MGEFIYVQDVPTSFGKYQIREVRKLKKNLNFSSFAILRYFLANQGPKLVEFLLNFELTRAKRAAENFNIFEPQSKMLFLSQPRFARGNTRFSPSVQFS